ncbi:MAG: DUF5671 domain-containing protein [Patescibacteria group bacterium]|jgi:hypothetical protein
MSDQSSSIRHLYFYLVAFIALGFVVGASVYILNFVGKVSVFPEAEVSFRGTPPGLFFNPSKDGAAPILTVTCTDTCSLTEADRTSIRDWQANYTSWQDQPSRSTNRNRGLVNALSFLIVALPIFWFHFRTAQRDFKAEAQQPQPDPKRAGRTIRTFYFYLVAFAAIVMFIISAGVTINTSLRTWLLAEGSTTNEIAKPFASSGTSDTEGVTSLAACAEKCKLDTTLVTQLADWQVDYDQAKAEMEQQRTKDWQRTLAMSIPFLLASIPLFWLHWLVIQRERKQLT